MKATKITPEANILPVPECRVILEECSDRQAILAWKLGFHYAVKSGPASRLVAEDFRWCNRFPVELRLPRADQTGEGAAWYLPVRANDQLLFASLLPERGPLFSTRDPYRILCRIAARHGIALSLRKMHRTCLSYAVASRCFHQHFLELARFDRWIFCPIPQAEALAFFDLMPPWPRLVAAAFPTETHYV